TVTGTASSSRFQQGENDEPRTSSTPAITFLIQEALISGGLGALAHDSSFVAVTRDEMAASSQLEMDEVEKAAVELLKRRETLQGTETGSAPLDISAAAPGSSPGLGAASSRKTVTATCL
ncbi:CAC1S protein, partial [Pomatostomus ruficeps]|nr:CAC1S protein [Pomatostomus ruficeps]